MPVFAPLNGIEPLGKELGNTGYSNNLHRQGNIDPELYLIRVHTEHFVILFDHELNLPTQVIYKQIRAQSHRLQERFVRGIAFCFDIEVDQQ